jgi:hypothetical protein
MRPFVPKTPIENAVRRGEPVRTGVAEPALAAVSAPEPAHSPPAPRELGLLAAPRLLEALGKPTRDPRVLLERAERLATAGSAITIVKTRLAPGAVENALAATPRTSRVLPVHYNGGIAGIRLEGFSPESVPSMAGLQSGDIVTSMNGVPIVTPERAIEAYAESKSAGMAVVEIVRGAQRVVLAVTWQPAR